MAHTPMTDDLVRGVPRDDRSRWAKRVFSPTRAYIESWDDRPGAFDPYTPNLSGKFDPPTDSRHPQYYSGFRPDVPVDEWNRPDRVPGTHTRHLRNRGYAATSREDYVRARTEVHKEARRCQPPQDRIVRQPYRRPPVVSPPPAQLVAFPEPPLRHLACRVLPPTPPACPDPTYVAQGALTLFPCAPTF
eukprot:NODE_5313_length_716_cov_25.064468_g4469_i0.p1 GENE.NODE_5313_length_716_cov_25.064468_g4469_i0~~NODE_5313_length_716_cov_25.064468_g4469_i0.p1  ORF type:complete len:189 (-),score=7.44 NODE_5313_length_716_cov_25.064468_g4469_i0:79-645(-)